jgi:hypothetical protein
MKDVSPEYIAQEEATKRKPVELYDIWRVGGLEEERNYTTGDVMVPFGGKDYFPATLKRSLIRYDSQLDVTKCTVQAAFVHDPVLEFIAINPVEIYWIRIMKLHRDQFPLEADVIFLGQIKGVSFKGIQADVECVGFEHFLKMPIPKERYQITCNWQVFDSRCKLDRLDYKITGVVTLDATKTILTSDIFRGSPVRIGVGTRAKVASGSMTPGEPSGVEEGDILICLCTQKDNIVATMSADWTSIYGTNNGTTSRASAWWARRGSSAPSYLITRSGGDSGIAAVVAYRGCIADGDPVNLSGTQNTSPTGPIITVPSIFTNENNCMLLLIAHAADDGTCGSFSGSNPSPVEFLDDNTSLGTDSGLAVDDGVQAGLGATGVRTAICSLAGLHIGAVIALKSINIDGWFIGGVAEFGVEKRTIVAHVDNTITIAYRMVNLADDDSVDVYPGCDGRNVTCRDKFDNIINFLGFPYIPIENPAMRT